MDVKQVTLAKEIYSLRLLFDEPIPVQLVEEAVHGQSAEEPIQIISNNEAAL